MNATLSCDVFVQRIITLTCYGSGMTPSKCAYGILPDKNVSISHAPVPWDFRLFFSAISGFRSFVPLYFRDAAAAVVVFDMTDRDSYNDARGWVDMVRNEAGPEVHIFLVGGKSDLKDSRTVLVDMVKAYASEQSIAYVEASALSGENVAQLFMLVGKQVIESRELLERKAAESAQSKKLDDKPPQARGGCKC